MFRLSATTCTVIAFNTYTINISDYIIKLRSYILQIISIIARTYYLQHFNSLRLIDQFRKSYLTRFASLPWATNTIQFLPSLLHLTQQPTPHFYSLDWIPLSNHAIQQRAHRNTISNPLQLNQHRLDVTTRVDRQRGPTTLHFGPRTQAILQHTTFTASSRIAFAVAINTQHLTAYNPS